MRTARAALAVVLASASACGGEPPRPPVVARPPPVASAAVPVTATRWVFPEGRRRVTARLDLGDGGTLYVGSDGLREVVRRAGPAVEAPTPRLEDFAQVLRDARAGLLFMSFEGDVLASREPLGPLELLHGGPLGKRGEHVEWRATPCGEDLWQVCDEAQDFATFGWALHRRPAGGEVLPVLYVPIRLGTPALAGSRGLIFAGNDAGFETADGGETWARTESVAARWLACGDVGCLDDDGAERVGWDLPKIRAPRDEVVIASPDPPSPAPAGGPAVPSPPPTDLVCKPAGAGAPLDGYPGVDLVDAAEVRWGALKRDGSSGRSWIAVANKARVREHELLPAAPKPKPDPSKGVTTISTGSACSRTAPSPRATGSRSIRAAGNHPSTSTSRGGRRRPDARSGAR
jgi:hypothetical protein